MMVTGASGFLGREIVEAACRAGWKVLAICRPTSTVPASWQQNPDVLLSRLDLEEEQHLEILSGLLKDVTCVIHAAATLSGSDVDQTRNTIEPTENLLRAMLLEADRLRQCQPPHNRPRLVLVSSFSVYDFARLPDQAVLDETGPVEQLPNRRDAYCRAKLAQEALAKAGSDRLELCLARPGAIYGPGRLWNWHLGIQAAGWTFCIDGDTLVPAISVDYCAAALVSLAGLPSADLPEIVNLLEMDLPSQRDWLATIGQRRIIYLKRRVLLSGAAIIDRLVVFWPVLNRFRPSGLRLENLAARFKPLQYSTEKVTRCLGPLQTRSFAEMMAVYRDAGAAKVSK
jgi:nucleoside-diphosphate-sugar epimerase